MIRKIIVSACISLSVYLTVAVILTMLPVKREIIEKSLNFDVLEKTADSSTKEQYPARDGSNLFFRFFNGTSDTILVLLHGSGTEGRYLTGLSEKLSLGNKAKVVVPDLRGHGQSITTTAGDVDYLGQLEDDLFDLNKHLRAMHPKATIILGGHSSGGGLAIKYGGKKRDLLFDGYVLLAPYLGYDAPTTRKNSGGWVQVSTRRYVGLSMLNNIGITLLNHTPVLFFNRPPRWDDGLQAGSYSYRMNESFSPQNYSLYLRQNKQPILVLVGLDDEAFDAEQYESVFLNHAPHADVQIFDRVKHLNLVNNTQAYNKIVKWLETFDS